MTFLLASLGSMIFWLFYVFATIIIGTLLIRKIAPNTFLYIIGKEPDYYCYDIMEIVVIVIFNYLFWIPILLFYIFYMFFKVLFNYILVPSFVKCVKFINDIIPDIEIKFKK